ncbi:hypothetical protein TNCV_2254791 [Trichonephila clavipes]|nr:hypothetical protein TNCV_2254791 [Trichonephila clavipes]
MAVVPSVQGIGSWLACQEFDPSTTQDPPCRSAMHVTSIESSNVLPLVWCEVLNTTLNAQLVTTANVPIVHCFTVWKICKTFDLKAKFVPLPGSTPPHRGVDQRTSVPVVGSFSVWKICRALDFPVTYDQQLMRTVFRKPPKPIPVVQSTAIFELFKALNLTVKLAPQ